MTEVRSRADLCAQRVRALTSPGDGISASSSDWTALLDAIRSLDSRFAFDAEGRPSALDAVRHALPSVERELFEVILDDYQCEIAALREAAYQLVLAVERSHQRDRD